MSDPRTITYRPRDPLLRLYDGYISSSMNFAWLLIGRENRTKRNPMNGVEFARSILDERFPLGKAK